MASPELVLLQAAETLPIWAIIQLGFELCGGYSLTASSEREGFALHQPLTTAAHIRSFLAKVNLRSGTKNARRAVPFILDRSASPMESIVAMLLHLPKRFGGYGLPAPQLNYPIKIGKGMKAGASTRLFCDVCWPTHRIAIEYDSNQHHVGADRIAHDAVRRLKLVANDMHVLTLTWAQLREFSLFDDLARQVAKRIGYRLRGLDASWRTAHLELKSSLLRNLRNPH